MKFNFESLRSAAIFGTGYGFGSNSLTLGLITFVTYFGVSVLVDFALKS